MNKRILLAGAVMVLVAMVVFSFRSGKSVHANPSPVHAGASVVQPSEPVVQVADPEPAKAEPAPEPDSTALEAYVLEAMTKWAPPSSMPGRNISHYPSIARDIAKVALEQAPLWKGDENRGRTAIQLAALAFFEGHYWSHVDDGSCNDMAKRKTQKFRAVMSVTGDCDGGIAYSLWQVHAHGVSLTDNGEWVYAWDDHANPGRKSLTGADLIADRRVAVRVALAMVRKSLRLSGQSLCGYSGEPGPCPKAKQRQDFAEAWSRKHPLK